VAVAFVAPPPVASITRSFDWPGFGVRWCAWLAIALTVAAAGAGAYPRLLRCARRPQASRRLWCVARFCESIVHFCERELRATGAGFVAVGRLFIGAAARFVGAGRIVLHRHSRQLTEHARNAAREWWTASWTQRLRMILSAASRVPSAVGRALLLLAHPLVALHEAMRSRRSRWANRKVRLAAVWSAILAVALPAAPMRAVAIDWNVNAAGNWGLNTNWNPTTVPDAPGAIARFQNNISANRIITIDVPRTIGELRIGDNNGTHAFTIGAAATPGLILNNSGSIALIQQNTTTSNNTIAAST
jgi:hypothetical protein